MVYAFRTRKYMNKYIYGITRRPTKQDRKLQQQQVEIKEKKIFLKSSLSVPLDFVPNKLELYNL